MMAKKKTAKKKVVLPKGARQGSKWTAEVVAEKKRSIHKVLLEGGSIASACEIVSIGRNTYNEWCKKDEKFRRLVEDAKKERKQKEVETYRKLIEYINRHVEKAMKKDEKITAEMRWWIQRCDRIQKQRDDRAERRERAVVEDGFRERQLQIQELQNKVDEEWEKRLLIEAQERKVWKEMASERRSNLLWAARQVVEQKVKTGVPAEEIAVSCEVRGAQLSAIAKKYAAHLADEKQQGDFVFGKHGATQDEIENVDIWYEMAAKIRSKPGEFEKRA